MLYLTAQQIRDIAAANDIQVTNHWNSTSVGNEAPTLNMIALVFTREVPEVLATLLSATKEVPVSISGTRLPTLGTVVAEPGFSVAVDRLTAVNAPSVFAEPAIAQ